MQEEKNLAFPQKLDIDSFPKEEKRKKRKKSGFLKKIKRSYREWQKEQKWKKTQKKRKVTFGEKVLVFILGPIADFIDDIRSEKAHKKNFELKKRPNLFQRLYWTYKENQEAAQHSKRLSKKIRKSLAFDVEQDKRVFSISDEWLHMKAIWKELPWNKNRELENILVTTLVIIIAFSFNYLLIQTAKYSFSFIFKIPASWESGRIVFNVPDASSLWTYSSVLSIYFFGPFLVFINAMLFLRLHSRTKDKSSFKSLVFLWVYLSAFVLFFGSFLAGIFTDRGFGYIMGWLFIPKYIEIPLGLFSVFMIWMIGFSAGKKFISFAPSQAFYTSVLPQFYIKTLYIFIPAITALMVLYLIGFNNRDFTIQIVYLSLIGMLTPSFRFIPEKMV